MMKNLEVLEEIRKQGKNLIETKRDEFVKQNLLSDEFIQMMQKNKKPFELLMSYYQCAIMEIETKFRVLNQEYSLSYDQNPIEGIKTRVKSYESIMRKIRVKDIPVTLESIEENIRDIAGVRVICSFPSDIYKLADSFLKQDDITLIERKDYIQHPKESGYRSLHLIVQVPIFLQDTKKLVFLFCFLCNQIPDILHTVIQLRALSCAVVEFILQIFDMIFRNIFLVAHLVLQTRPEIHRDRTELYFHVDQFLCIL